MGREPLKLLQVPEPCLQHWPWQEVVLWGFRLYTASVAIELSDDPLASATFYVPGLQTCTTVPGQGFILLLTLGDSNCDLSLEWMITEGREPLRYPEQWSLVTKRSHSKFSSEMESMFFLTICGWESLLSCAEETTAEANKSKNKEWN